MFAEELRLAAGEGDGLTTFQCGVDGTVLGEVHADDGAQVHDLGAIGAEEVAIETFVQRLQGAKDQR